MKKILAVLFLIVSACVAAYFTIESFKAEHDEANLSVAALPLMTSIQTNQDYAIACNEEHQTYLPQDVPENGQFAVSDVQKFSSGGLGACAVGPYIAIGKITVSLFEAANIPVKATVPYEVVKRLLLKSEDTKNWRCSDYVDAIATICPVMVSRFVKRDQSSTVESK